MQVPLLDLKRQYASLKTEIDEAIQTVLDHGLFVMGPEVKELEAQVADSRKPESWQKVDPGDATDLVSSETLTVQLPVGDELIGNISISPNVCTPNGDGQNEEVTIAFSVFKVNVPRLIKVTVYSLNGEQILELLNRVDSSGNY